MPAEYTWTKDQGFDGLYEYCEGTKRAWKRGLYNQITKAEEALHALRAGSTPPDIPRAIETFKAYQGHAHRDIMDVRKSLPQIGIMLDRDIIRRASEVFQTITVENKCYTGQYGRLEITWRDATYYIGEMMVKF